MTEKIISWQQYYENHCKDIAANKNISSSSILEYGEKIYTSPNVPIGTGESRRLVSWQVNNFNDKYNVFCAQQNDSGNWDLQHAKTFYNAEAATQFALEMLLICSGKLKRNDFRNERKDS